MGLLDIYGENPHERRIKATGAMFGNSGFAKPALAYVMGRELGGAEEWDKEKGEAVSKAAADKQEREESWKMIDVAFKLSENDPVGATQFIKKAATKNQYVARYGDVQFKSKTKDKWSTIVNSKTGETYLINTDLLMSNQELPDEQAQELTRQVAERYDLVVDPFKKEFGEFQAKEPQKAQEAIQEIRKGVFKIFDPAPEVPKTPKTKDLMYQDKSGNYRFGLFDDQGNLVKDMRAATDKEINNGINGETSVAQERIILSHQANAKTEALKKALANKPNELAVMMANIQKNPDNASAILGQAETSMTPEQTRVYDTEYRKSFLANAPGWAGEEMKQRWAKSDAQKPRPLQSMATGPEVPLSAAPKTQHPLTGREAGIYRVNGRVVKWDGSRELQ